MLRTPSISIVLYISTLLLEVEKNYWANKLLDPKATGGKYYRVLYITSRKATAAAEVQKTNTRRYINLDEILRTEKAFGKLRQCGFTLTNSGVEKLIKHIL